YKLVAPMRNDEAGTKLFHRRSTRDAAHGNSTFHSGLSGFHITVASWYVQGTPYGRLIRSSAVLVPDHHLQTNVYRLGNPTPQSICTCNDFLESGAVRKRKHLTTILISWQTGCRSSPHRRCPMQR